MQLYPYPVIPISKYILSVLMTYAGEGKQRRLKWTRKLVTVKYIVLTNDVLKLKCEITHNADLTTINLTIK